MNLLRRHPLLLNLIVLGVTVVVVGFVLVIGREDAPPVVELAVGDPAPETYRATAFVEVPDEAATEIARERAALNVESVFKIDTLARSRVEGQIRSFFNDVRAAPLGPDPIVLLTAAARSPIPTSEPNTYTIDYTVTVENPSSRPRAYELRMVPRFAEAVTIEGVAAVIDLGRDGRLDGDVPELTPEADAWLVAGETPGVSEAPSLPARAADQYIVTVTFSGDAALVTDETSGCGEVEDGTRTGLLVDVETIVLDNATRTQACRVLPTFVVEEPAEGEGAQDSTTSSSTSSTTSSTTTTTTLPVEAQVATLEGEYLVYGEAIPVLVDLYATHLADLASGGDGFFDTIEQDIVDLADDQLAVGIKSSELTDVRNSVLADPPRIVIPELDADELAELRRAAAIVVAQSLEANEVLDEEATRLAEQSARDSVELQVVSYQFAQPIVQEGEAISAVQLEAINKLGLLAPEPGTSRTAAMVLGGLAVLLAALFLWRLAPEQWSQPKHIAILGILMAIAAVIARVPELLGAENSQLSYAIPAAMLGYAAAIVYDPRTALMTSVPMAIFTAITTQDASLVIFAAAATVTPIAFVSAVSTRRQLRLAVTLSAVVLAPLAGTVVWLFSGEMLGDAMPEVYQAGLAGFAGGVIGSLLGQGLVSFLENAFQLTTTITLLDLTDRNHPALRLIEEKAPGTFNHSILVGNLAGRAARAIGADPLFAQAAAFYHDLGKTENPQYFIENQFGVSNPHDQLDPVESAAIIRRHVTDGLRLARIHRIPPDVAAGVEQHHGSGLMRYFYHKAMEVDPAVDPTLFRHGGQRPQRKEMAILMISDAVEGAARSLAQQEDPTADSLAKLVDSIVGEKLDDGQFDESALTFGDLTRVKRALVDALIGYYHTRIPYPGFPGPRVGSA